MFCPYGKRVSTQPHSHPRKLLTVPINYPHRIFLRHLRLGPTQPNFDWSNSQRSVFKSPCSDTLIHANTSKDRQYLELSASVEAPARELPNSVAGPAINSQANVGANGLMVERQAPQPPTPPQQQRGRMGIFPVNFIVCSLYVYLLHVLTSWWCSGTSSGTHNRVGGRRTARSRRILAGSQF